MLNPSSASFRSLGSRRGPIVIGAFAGAFLFAVTNAAVRPLWFDELLTLYVSRLGNPIEIWTALEQTADGQPPLSYLLTACSCALFGESELATRLPSLLAFLVATYAFYFWTAERIGALYGVIAAGFLWTTFLLEYSYEARPYTLLTACVALSLLFWRRACGGPRRYSGLLGLSLVVALAMASHYYAIFSLFAVGAGELARTWRRRKLDILVWAALSSGAGTVLFYLPLITKAREVYSNGFWSPANVEDLLVFYFVCLYPAALSLFAIPYLIILAWKPPQASVAEETKGSFPVEECVAMWVLAASPVLTIGVSLFTTNAYVFRYSLPAALALAWIYTTTVHGLIVERRERAAWIVACLIAVCFISRGVTRAGLLPTEFREGFRTGRTFAALEERLSPSPRFPIIVTSPMDFLPFYHYAPKHWREGLVYLSDAQACLQEGKKTTAEVNLNRLARWVPLRIEQRLGYMNSRTDFLLLDPIRTNWVRSWIPICRKFDEKNLIRLYETKDFVLYRWSASSEAKTNAGLPPTLEGASATPMPPFH